ncbi:hypothetical protein BD769DRAFT_1392281 [Suillus cothurnatus]|nr:hypothetical protein BD769DRAFT_1392281 [Suillus cothurnatus]
MNPRPTLYVLGMKYIPPPAASQSCSGRVFWGEKTRGPWVFVHGKIGQEIWRWYWPFYTDERVPNTACHESTERANDQYRSNLAMKISAMLGRRQFAAKVRSGALEKLEKLSIHDHRHAPSLVWPGRLIEGWFILRQALNVWGILHRAGAPVKRKIDELRKLVYFGYHADRSEENQSASGKLEIEIRMGRSHSSNGVKRKSKRPWQGREEGMRPEEWHHEGENSPSRRTTGHEEIRACGKELPYIAHITAAHRTGKGGSKDGNGRCEEKRGDGGLRGPGNVGEGTRKHGRGNGGIFVMGPGNAEEGCMKGGGDVRGLWESKEGGGGRRLWE